MAAQAIGNIWIGLNVDTKGTRNFTSAASVIARDSNRMRQALGGTNTSVHALRASMSQGMRSRIFSDMIRQASQTNNEVAKLRATMMGLAAITGTSVTGAFAATFLLQTADQANRLNNQLRTVTSSEEDLVAVRQRLYNVSQLTRSDMSATITLYARLSRAAEEFGQTQEQTVRITETVQKAFAIGGATQAEAQGAALQLSQGIASDRFSGDEYRSVAENAPVLLQQMAKHLGVTIGKLREMAHAGQLTGKVVSEAILGASSAIDESFNKTITTVGQSLSKVGNAFLMYVGETDASLGVTQRLSAALAALADNMDSIAAVAAPLAGIGLAMFGGRTAGKAAAGAFGGIAAGARDARKATLEAAAASTFAAKAEEIRARSVKQSTAAELASTQARVAAGQADAAALRQTMALAQEQRNKAVARTELNRGIVEATGRTGTYTTALKAQHDATRTVIVTQRTLRQIEGELAANKALLVTQTKAAATAAALHNDALVKTSVSARAAAVSMSAMRLAAVAAQRVGSGILGLMGGWTGVAFTAAIIGMGLYSANAAKAQERTAKLTAELHALGLISDEVAGVVGETAQSLDDLNASAARNKLREITDELARIKGEQNIFDQMFAYDPKMLGNMLDQLGAIRARGSNVVGADRSSAMELESIVIAARDGTDTVEGLQERLDRLAASNPNMAGWLDRMVENLKLTLPYMDGLQTRAEQLEAKLQSLNASGISSGWIQEIMDQEKALSATQDAAASLAALADAQVNILGMTAEETRLRKAMADLTKDALAAGIEEANMQEAVVRFYAQKVIAAEDEAEARKKAAEAQDDFNKKVVELSADIDDATSSFEDMQAAATIKRLLSDFATGTMKAETLKDRLAEVNSVNLSDPMDKLIEKIIAAIGPLAQLLGLFNSFGGNSSPLGGDLPGPATPRGAAGRSRREFLAQQKIGQGVLDSAVADAGMSERDAWIKDKTADLQKQAEALGGVATGAAATAAALWDMDQAQNAAKKSGKGAADAAAKYAEGMAELNRELAAAPLDPFLKQVLSSAEGMGIATDELDAFVAAVTSGGLSAAPEKFREIAAAMQEVKAINLLNDLDFERAQMFRSETDQRVASSLYEMGLTESDPYGAMIAGQIRLNEALSDGKDIAKDFLGGLTKDLRDGVPIAEALSNAFGRLGERLLDMALDAAINTFLGSLFGSGLGLGGGVTKKGGLLGGSIIPGILHGGGVAGRDGYGHSRALPAATWAGAPRFHSGLGNKEFAAILEDGERVLTADQSVRTDNLLSALGTGRTEASNVGRSILEVTLSDDLKARIIQEAAGQAVQITRGMVEPVSQTVNQMAQQQRFG